MEKALLLAKTAAELGEVPVGAIVVAECDGEFEVIGEGSNAPIRYCDPTAHAEVIALRSASEKAKNYRLPESTLYVTLEPCTMCFGAMVHARIKRLVYAASEPKAGVISSNLQLHQAAIYNHTIEVTGSVMEDSAKALMQSFFKSRR